ncbi:pericentrin isoform X2 [Scyliorhinus canicula]|uniref:pericentrin isoform X2 n=1 Tax=Scyliorhinus canicula TaxID=7830 RepID=UPI0018F56EE3|nr:pericentrin isoform X2 [Scyliorhinus canicula]
MEDEERRRKLQVGRAKFAHYQQQKAKGDCSDSTKKKKRKSQAIHQDDVPPEEHSLAEQDGAIVGHEADGELPSTSTVENLSVEVDEMNNSTGYAQTDLQVCRLKVIKLEEQLQGKEMALEHLIAKVENLQDQLTAHQESEQLQQELEMAVQKRNDIISQLTDNLQQVIRNRDEVQQEALKLTDQIQSLQQQLQQASETLKSKSPGYVELLQAQQQISLFQQNLKDQSEHMETLEERARDLEVQLEDSEQNARDKDSCLTQIVEQQKITEHTMLQLNQWIEEKDETIKELKETLDHKNTTVSQLQHSLSLRNQEIATPNGNFECAIEQSGQQALEEIGEQKDDVENMQDQFGQKDVPWYVEQLRADLGAIHSQEPAQVRQELGEQTKKEIASNGEVDFLQSQVQNDSGPCEQVQILNGMIIDLNKKLQESSLEQEILHQKLEKMIVSQQEQEKYRHLVQDLEEQTKLYKSEKEHLNHEIQELNAFLAQEKEVSKEMRLRHEHEITNYRIKLEMMEREKDEVLSRLAESQEVELEQLKTKMLFSHEEELSKLREDLEIQHNLKTEALGMELKCLKMNLRSEVHQKDINENLEAMDQGKAILSVQCAELTKQLQQRELELEILNTEAKNSASQTQEAVQKWKAVTQELSNLRLQLEKESTERLRCEEQTKGLVLESKGNALEIQPEQISLASTLVIAKDNVKKDKEIDIDILKGMVQDLKEEKQLLLTQLREQEQLVKGVQEQKLAADSVTSEVQALFGRQLAALQSQRDQLQVQLEAQKVKSQTISEVLGQKTMQDSSLRKELEELRSVLRGSEECVNRLTEEKIKLESKVLSNAQDLSGIEEVLNKIKAENNCLRKDNTDFIHRLQDLDCTMQSKILALDSELKGKVTELQKLEAVMEEQKAQQLQEHSALKLEVNNLREKQQELEKIHNDKFQTILQQQEERLRCAVQQARVEVTSHYEAEQSKVEELYRSDVMNLKMQHQKELDDLNVEMKKALDLQQKQEDEKRNQIGLIKRVHEREHDREMSTLITKHKEEVEQQRAELTQEQQDLFNDVQTQMESAHEAEIYQIRFQMQQEHHLELESLRLSLNNMHRAQLELVQSNLQREKEESLAELQEMLNDKRRQEVAVLQNRKHIELECIKEQNQLQMEQTLEKHQQEIEDLRKALEEDTALLTATVVAEETKKLQNMQKEWEEECRMRIEKQGQAMSAQHQTELEEWGRKMEKLQNELVAIHNEIEERQTFEKNERQNLEGLHQSNLTKLQEQIQVEVQQKQELMKELDEKQKDHLEAMKNLQASYDEFKLRSEQDVVHLWSQLESSRTCREELSEFREHLLARTSRVEDVEHLKQELAEQREQLQKQHICELEQLKNYFEEKLKDVQEKNNKEVAQLEQRLQEEIRLPLGLESELSLNQTVEPSLSLLSFTDLTEKNYFQHRIQIVEELAQKLEQYKEEIKILRLQLEEKHKQEKATSLMHKEEMQKIESELSQRFLAKHGLELDQLQAQLSEEHLKEITKLRLQCAQETAREVEVVMEECLQRLEETKISNQAALDSERRKVVCLQEEIECLKSDHATTIMELSEQLKEMNQDKTQLLEETNRKLHASGEAFEAKMQECAIEKERELKILREELEANHEEKISALRNQLLRDFEEERRALEQEFNQRNVEMNKLQEEQRATISKLEAQLKEEKTHLQQLQDSLTNEQLPEIVVIRQKIQVQFDAELAMAKSLMAEEFEKLQVNVQEQSALKHLEVQNRFMEEHRQMMDNFMSEQEILLQELKKRHAEELENQSKHLMENHLNQVEDLKAGLHAKHQEEMEALEKEKLAAFETLKLKHSADLEDVACKHQSEIYRLQEAVKTYEEDLDTIKGESTEKLDREVNQLKTDHETELSNAQEMIRIELAAIHMEKFKAMAAELEEIHKVDLEAALGTQKALLEQEHQSRLDVIREEVLRLEDQHQQALKELQMLQSMEAEKQKEEYTRMLSEELKKIQMYSQKEQVHTAKSEIEKVQQTLQSHFEIEKSQQLRQFQEEFELLKNQSELLLTQEIKQLKDEFEVEKNSALQELRDSIIQEQDKAKNLHLEEKEHLSAKFQQQTELTKQLQKEIQDKNSELETLLQRRDRENEEGGNLVAMLRSDLERLTTERRNLENSHEQVQKLFLEVVRVIFASEDMISRQIGLCLDKNQPASILNQEERVNNSSLLGARGQPPWTKAKALLEQDKGDLGITQENTAITEDCSFWSALSDEGLELSQWLSESMFAGPDVGPENEELILSTCVRLQVAVGKLLELVTESSRQLAQSHGINEHLEEEFTRKNQETVELVGKQHQKLIEHLNDESEAKKELALELHKAEGLIEGYVSEKAVLEEALQQKEESEKHLALKVELLTKQLHELNQEHQRLLEERDLLLRQKQAMAGNEVERGLHTEPVIKGDSGLLEEAERLSKEKLDIQCQADKDRADLLSRTKRMEVELEAETNRNFELEDKWHLEVTDMQQQIQALEKQLKNYRQFMDEQAAEREHERDEFQQEIENLERQLKQGLKSQGSGDYTVSKMETMEAQIQSKTDDYNELLLTKEHLERDVQEEGEEIEKLKVQIKELEQVVLSNVDVEKRIHQLEQEMQKMRRIEEELTQDKESLQQQQYNNLMQISALQSKLDEARHRVPVEGFSDQSLKEQLLNERQALQTKEDEIQSLEEQLDQFRENLMNRNDEMLQLNMQLEIQTKQSAMTINKLHEENIRVKEDVASLHLRLGMDVDSDRVPRLQLPQALLQEKNQEIDELKEQIFKLQQELENTLDNKIVEEKNSEIEDLKARIEQLRVDQDRLRQAKEEEIDHLIEVIEKLQQELSLLGPNRHEVSDSQEDLEMLGLEKESRQNAALSRGLNDNLQQELACIEIDNRAAGDYKEANHICSTGLQDQTMMMVSKHVSLQLLDKKEAQFQEKVDALQTNLQNLQEVQQQQLKESVSFRLQHNTLQEDNSLLRTHISQRDADVALLSSRVQELEDAQTEKDMLLQMIEKQRQVELEEMGCLSTRIAELEQELFDKTAQFQKDYDEIQTLRSDILERNGVLQTLKQKDINSQEELERLQGELAKWEVMNKDLKDNLKQLEKEKEAVDTVLAATELKLQDEILFQTQEKLKEMDATLQQKEIFVTQLSTEHKGLQAELSKVKEELNSSTERIEKLLEAEQEKDHTIADLETHTRNLKAQVNQLQEVLLQQEEELANRAKEVENLSEKCHRQGHELLRLSTLEADGPQVSYKEISQTVEQDGHQPFVYNHAINESLLSSPEMMRKYEESLEWMNGLHLSRVSEISGVHSTDMETMHSRSLGLGKDTDEEGQSINSAKEKLYGHSPSTFDYAHSLSKSSDAEKVQSDAKVDVPSLTALQEDGASTVSIPDWISDGCSSNASLDLGAKLNQELETTERLDNSFVEYLQHRGMALVDLDSHQREHKLPGVEVPSRQLQALLNRVHEEGCRVLALSERPFLCVEPEPVSVLSKTMKEWQQEKRALLETIQLLKDLLSTATNKDDEDSTGRKSDWRGELLLAVQGVFKQEQKSFLAELRSCMQNQAVGGENSLPAILERILRDQEKQQQSALEDLLSVDRSSLLSEVQDLRSQLRIAHLQHQEKLQQLQDTLTSAEELAKKQERPLRRQVELLEYKHQQEQIITNNLQNTLRAEQERSTKLRQQLQTEQTSLSELKSDMSEVTDELQAALQTRHELQQNLQNLRGELNAKENELLTAAKAFEQERQNVQQLQNMMEKEQFHLKEQKDQERQTYQKLQKVLEEQHLQNHQLSVAFEKEQMANSSSQKEIETKLLHTESLLLQEHKKLADTHDLLKIERNHSSELSDSLDRERTRSEQLYQRLNSRHDETATQERAFIKELQNQLEDERKRTVELATMIEKTQQQAITAKRNFEDEIQLSRQDTQKEREVSSKLRSMLESIQAQVQELNRLLESERQHSLRLQTERERLQANILAAKEKERNKDDQRDRERRQERRELADHEQEYEMVKDRMHELELQHQRDQQQIRELQKMLADLEEQERKLLTRKRQRGEPESILVKCNQNGATHGMEGNTVNIQQHQECTQQQFLQLTVRLKELLHRSEHRGLEGHIKTEDIRDLLKILIESNYDSQQFLSSTQEKPIDHLDLILNIERANWMKERSQLKNSLKDTESELARVMGEIENRPLRHDLVDPSSMKMQRLYGKYLRAESFRKALVYQKKYLLLLLGGFQECEQATLCLIARMGVYPSPTDLHMPIRRPLTRFRSAIRVVIAISRLKFLVKKWQKATRKGLYPAPPANGNGSGQAQTIRSEVFRQQQPTLTHIMNSPPTRDSISTRRLNISSHQTPKSQYRSQIRSHFSSGGGQDQSGVSNNQDPERSLTEYIQRLEAIQQQLGGTSPGTARHRSSLK